MKKTLSVLVALFGMTSGFCAVKMASQPWTQMVVSNAVSDTKEWVKMNYPMEGEEINKETDMWVSDDGTKLVYMIDGVEKYMTIESVTTQREVDGFFVSYDTQAGGVVSNGMFYAYVGDGKYSCPSNFTIPTIVQDCIVTQVYFSVTNYYKNLLVYEYVNTPTNNYIITWESQQISPQDWRLFNVDSDGNMRYFNVNFTKGLALDNSPLAE